ncbi:MAG: EamA family transporter [Candidatus Eisenbacteria bacterium]|nr:EamA family transporter [Candidatus Eisenbacteria bacterium]
MRTKAQLYALLAAALFGASAPFAKLLLRSLQPLQLSGLLYLGSGLGLLLFRLSQRFLAGPDRRQAALRRDDVGWLVGAVICGGLLAPAVLMYSLSSTPAAVASLLLNFEAVSTTFIAAVFFKEQAGRRLWLAVAVITIGSLILTVDRGAALGLSFGSLGVLTACFLWGIDNNLTRHISGKDPVMIVVIKGLGAGSFALALSFWTGSSLTSYSTAFLAMLLGCLSYGVSLLLFILALRDLGSSRASALFGTAPFLGALVSFITFRYLPSVQFLISVPVMLLGAFLLLRESHGHLHLHTNVLHEHPHTHDEHHGHTHDDSVERSSERHSHAHKHETLQHEHAHVPDIHHRHEHH